MLSTETLLHFWLSTEYYGFLLSSTAVDTGGHPGFNGVKAYSVILLSEFVSMMFFFLAKSVGKLLCRRFSYEEQPCASKNAKINLKREYCDIHPLLCLINQ